MAWVSRVSWVGIGGWISWVPCGRTPHIFDGRVGSTGWIEQDSGWIGRAGGMGSGMTEGGVGIG